MNKFEIMPGEEIEQVIKNVEVKANENKFNLNVFLTNKRLVLLKDVSKELLTNTFLRAKSIQIPEDLEVVFKEDLKNIKTIEYIDDTTKIRFTNSPNTLLIKAKINILDNK